MKFMPAQIAYLFSRPAPSSRGLSESTNGKAELRVTYIRCEMNRPLTVGVTMLFARHRLWSSMLLAAVAAALAGSGCGSDPCRAACRRWTSCFGDAAAGPSCPFEQRCADTAHKCAARCAADAPCSALDGSDPAAAQSLARCAAACVAAAPDGAPAAQDGAPAADAIAPPPSVGGECGAEGCPGGYYCDLGSNRCLAGCAVDMQCGSDAVCNRTTHDCCAAGQSVCDGHCVDLAADPAHCGACDNACAGIGGGHALCSGGKCSAACDGGRTLCGAQCVLTASDRLHCGGCNRPCEPPAGGTTSCVDGRCAPKCAGTGQTVCDGACVDLQRDLANCGACGKSCPAGGGTPACVAGLCSISCASGATLCGDACVNLDSDPKNCGSCGKVCPTGGDHTAPKCSSGKCGLYCYSPTFSCVNTCCDPTLSGGAHCCTGTDSYGKTFGYCLKYGYSCY